LTSLKDGADRLRLGLFLAASALFLPTAQAAGLRIGSVESIAPIEISAPRTASGRAIAGRRELRFDAFGRRFELRLEATPGFAPRLAPAGFEALQGEVLGHSGSWVRLTRNGGQWTGLIFDGLEYFGVESAGTTARFNAQARRMPAAMQVVYRLRDAHVEDASHVGDMVPAGTTLEGVVNAVASELPPPTLAATLATQRLDVGVVLDAEQVERDGPQATADALARMNIVDGIFSNQVGVRIAVTTTTALTPGSQPFDDTTVPGDLLKQLSTYRAGSQLQQATGLTHLFTARDLDGQTVGIAYIKSICSANFGASLSEARTSAPTEALIAAHEIGHGFGAPHDNESGSACESAPSGFLMAAQVAGSQTFSDCSLAQIAPVVAAASCLAPVDAADAALGAPLSADVAVGQASTVGLSVRSNGNTTVLGVRVTIDLPAGVEAAGAGTTGGGACTILPGRVECALGDLAPGESRDVEMSLVAALPGATQARLTVSAQNDQQADNDSATLRLVASPGADLGVSVKVDPVSVLQGATTTARILLRNFGLNDATDVQLLVTPDAGLVPGEPTGTGISCTTAAGAVTCVQASLAAGATAELLLPLQGGASASGPQRLFLSLRSAELTDPQPGNNEATVMVTVTAPPPPPPPPATSTGSGGGGGTLGFASLLALALAGLRIVGRRRAGLGLALLAAPCLLAPQPLRAEVLPLWELGMGIGALGFSDYRGAAGSQVYPVPVPYVVYRGRVLRADREGLHGLLFDEPRASLQLSLNATTPVDSDASAARAGMADLDPVIEAGPSLDLHLWRSADQRLLLDFRIPARAAFTVSADPRHIGWLLSPRINLDVRHPAGLQDWNLGLLAGPLFADRRYHDYFYSVAAAFATPGRPAHAAAGGYSGSQFLVSASRRFPRTWFGAFVRYDWLDGAAFDTSPLVLRRSAWSAGFGFAWIFARSARLVDADG
jgi:outer membrane scaffolding protein for murein synthesis (MipA/OmpV family)